MGFLSQKRAYLGLFMFLKISLCLFLLLEGIDTPYKGLK